MVEKQALVVWVGHNALFLVFVCISHNAFAEPLWLLSMEVTPSVGWLKKLFLILDLRKWIEVCLEVKWHF